MEWKGLHKATSQNKSGRVILEKKPLYSNIIIRVKVVNYLMMIGSINWGERLLEFTNIHFPLFFFGAKINSFHRLLIILLEQCSWFLVNGIYPSDFCYF